MKLLALAQVIQWMTPVCICPNNGSDSVREGWWLSFQGIWQDLRHLHNCSVIPCNLYEGQVLKYNVRCITCSSNTVRNLISSPCIKWQLVKLVVVITEFFMGIDEPVPDLEGKHVWKELNDIYNMCLKAFEDAVCHWKKWFSLHSWHLGCCRLKHFKPLSNLTDHSPFIVVQFWRLKITMAWDIVVYVILVIHNVAYHRY